LALLRAVRQRGAQREAHHLLRRPLLVVARLRPVRDTATAPLRRADRTLTGTARALLAPRLRTATRDVGAALGAVRAGARGGELRGHDLVHDCDVRLDAEDVVGEVDGAGLAAGRSAHVHGGQLVTSDFTALRTNTRPPLGPGTEPRMRRSPRSASPSTTVRFSVVTRSPP